MAASALERRFTIHERGSTVRVEVLGGFVTFLTMAYIVFVNPAILSAAGMPFAAVAVATSLAAAIFTLLMGLLTNLPFALGLRARAQRVRRLRPHPRPDGCRGRSRWPAS